MVEFRDWGEGGCEGVGNSVFEGIYFRWFGFK